MTIYINYIHHIKYIGSGSELGRRLPRRTRNNNSLMKVRTQLQFLMGASGFLAGEGSGEGGFSDSLLELR